MTESTNTPPPRRPETPLWLLWVLGGLALIGVNSVFVVWGESRPIGGWFEQVVAEVAYFGSITVPIYAAYRVGKRIQAWLELTWLSWLVGLVAWFLLGFALLLTVEAIPGVGWRIDRMMDSESYSDW